MPYGVACRVDSLAFQSARFPHVWILSFGARTCNSGIASSPFIWGLMFASIAGPSRRAEEQLGDGQGGACAPRFLGSMFCVWGFGCI